MSRLDIVELACPSDLTGAEFCERLSALLLDDRRPVWVLVRADDVNVPVEAMEALLAGVDERLVASRSPVPVDDTSLHAVAVGTHPAGPPAAPIPLPCIDLCAVATEALLCLAGLPGDNTGTWRVAFASRMQQLANAGWRHVVSPGVAFGWSGVTAPPDTVAGWTDGSVRSVVHAQPSVEALRLWAATRLRPLRVVIDGACVSDDVHNGTQVVVLQLSRALAASRSDAHVALAVPRARLGVAAELLRGTEVEVVERRHVKGAAYDLAYRPYQAIDPSEFEWLASAGRRLLVGQLDMIGFSNPSYHPSVELFHTVRNLQRHMMRAADGVTFISDFGRETARAECPEIPQRRTHVVGCGVDVGPVSVDSVVPPTSAESFIVCLSATFHHKNRAHAIRTFASLCERHGYSGSLVIAGPEPYYGRSDDSSLIETLKGDVARRIERLGRTDVATKWWLLRHADLVLYPSVVEGFGLVPFEASAVGTPSLSYAGTALKEVLDAEEALVATWDPDVWADRALLLIRDEAQRSRAVECVVAAGARHQWADVASRTWEVIDATIAAPSVNPVDEGSAWARIGYPQRMTRRLTSTRHLVVRIVAGLARRLMLVGDQVRSRR